VVDALKRRCQLRVVDSHVHATDVLNVIDLRSYRRSGSIWALGEQTYRPDDLEKIDLLASLEHNRWQQALERVAFRLLPGVVNSAIRHSYAFIGEQRIRDELSASGVDAVVLLTLAPVGAIDEVHPFYGAADHLHYLGSIDLHAIDADEVAPELQRQQEAFGILGIKLHPNLQGFYPDPDHNPPPLGERLHRVYSAAEKLGLYVLLHAGASLLLHPSYQIDRYPQIAAAGGPRYGLLERFCDETGRSRLFDAYRCRFVLAHMGHFGVQGQDRRLFRLAERYPRILFDTAVTTPQLVARFVEEVGADQLLFGSDGLYNRLLAELIGCLKGIEEGSAGDRFEENAVKVLGGNFERLIGSHSRSISPVRQ
jgi:predicted TIM-barrel fold metal-dependent hydrolase